MWFNVITLKNGRTVPFTTDVPYSVDKIAPGWNLVTDEANGSIISFVGDEVAVVGSQDLDKVPVEEPKKKPNRQKRRQVKPGKKKPGFKATVVEK